MIETFCCCKWPLEIGGYTVAGITIAFSCIDLVVTYAKHKDPTNELFSESKVDVEKAEDDKCLAAIDRNDRCIVTVVAVLMVSLAILLIFGVAQHKFVFLIPFTILFGILILFMSCVGLALCVLPMERGPRILSLILFSIVFGCTLYGMIVLVELNMKYEKQNRNP